MIHDEPAARAAHELPVHEAILLVGTDRQRGLSEEEAARRLASWGPNALPRVQRRGPLPRFALQFHHPLIYLLLVAAAVTLVVGGFVDAFVILGVVLANAAIGYVQESRAEQAMEALAATLTQDVTVLRGGEHRRISSAQVVPGDLLLLQAGEMVGADVRLTDAQQLDVDESALTGESVPSRKSLEPLPSGTVVGDRQNMAHSGTLVTRGAGAGVVMATGAQTEIGLIHRLMGEAQAIATPLTRKMARFSRMLAVGILALAAATYAVGLARGEAPGELFVAAVALSVGAIPEGLPAAITITLAIGVSRMARRHAIVRKLPAVETLGSTTVICTDKTGTLTANEMTVQAVTAGGERFEVSGTGYRRDGAIHRGGVAVAAAESPALRECLLAGTLCNDSRVRPEGEVVGDPTEAALLTSAAKGGIDPSRAALEHPRLSTVPFESERRFMATLHDAAPESGPVVYVKGAVETVLGMCSDALGSAGERRPLEEADVLAEAHALAGEGLRVLAFARGDAGPGATQLDPDAAPADLEFLGLQAMMDPPRPEAVTAVAACQRAGVTVKMITGDHAATAQAIAHRIGLDGGGAAVMTGADIDACPPGELTAAAARTAVFARVSPEQKLRLVEALQEQGEIVAMTGDGVNDAPALKRADIGIAMGLSGTQVAREASDVVLTDDNFASIEAAVEEGRRIFDNLTKFIVWTLPTNMGEGLLIVTAIVAGVALPVLPVQVLWINMTTAVALGLMLAFERAEPGIMKRSPRDPAQPLLSAALLGRMLLVSVLLLVGSFWLFEWEQAHGATLEEARTVAVNVFVVGEIFYLLNCRSLEGSMLSIGVFGNRPLLAGVAATIALQLLFTYTGAMQSLFHSAAIDGEAWLRIGAVGLAIWGAVGAEKWLRRRRPSGARLTGCEPSCPGRRSLAARPRRTTTSSGRSPAGRRS